MTITLEIPDEFASRILTEGSEPSRQALEDMAVEAYRRHRITGFQLRKMLGISSRYELNGFLKERRIWLEYTLEDFVREGEIVAAVRPREETDKLSVGRAEAIDRLRTFGKVNGLSLGDMTIRQLRDEARPWVALFSTRP